MKGTDIISVARQQLKDFIAFEIKNIYLLINGHEPDFCEDEEYVVEIQGLTIGIEVDNSYLDVEEPIIENRSIGEVHLTLDENVFLVPEVGDDTEIEWTEISTDELVALANVLEHTYNNLVKE